MTKHPRAIVRRNNDPVKAKASATERSEKTETYRSLKPGEVEVTERGRRLMKLYRKALA